MGTITNLVTDEARQAAALDQAEEVISRSLLQYHRNVGRRNVWRIRFHADTGVWPSHHTAYPTPNKLKGTK